VGLDDPGDAAGAAVSLAAGAADDSRLDGGAEVEAVGPPEHPITPIASKATMAVAADDLTTS
jgi:hypothetical protein